jgi:hypothetical protein
MNVLSEKLCLYQVLEREGAAFIAPTPEVRRDPWMPGSGWQSVDETEFCMKEAQ